MFDWFTQFWSWLAEQFNYLWHLADFNYWLQFTIIKWIGVLPPATEETRSYWNYLYETWSIIFAYTAPLNYFIDLQLVGYSLAVTILIETSMVVVHAYRGIKDMVPFAG